MLNVPYLLHAVVVHYPQVVDDLETDTSSSEDDTTDDKLQPFLKACDIPCTKVIKLNLISPRTGMCPTLLVVPCLDVTEEIGNITVQLCLLYSNLGDLEKI